MLEFLIELDKVLFILINDFLANPVTDWLMPILTSDNILRVVFVVIIASLLIFGDTKKRWLALFAGIVLFLTDQAAAGILKPLIERARPCHTFDDVRLLVEYCGSGFSMPSAHAANVFGQAALLAGHVRFIRWPLYTYAVLVAISRVFVGVHYPGDIIIGAIVGLLAGSFISKLYDAFNRIVLVEKSKTKQRKTQEKTDAGEN